MRPDPIEVDTHYPDEAKGLHTVEPTHTGWRIQLLGAFAVSMDGAWVEPRRWRLRKAKSLIAILALAPGQRRHREYLLDRLWPDLEPLAAAKNLHQTLYVARHALVGGAVPRPGLLGIRNEQVVLDDAGPVEVDALRFEQTATAGLTADDAGLLRAAADLYTADLLLDLPDADALSDRREEFKQTHREVLVRLATLVQRSNPGEAAVLLTRVLETDPVHEGAVRAQMETLARLGRRSEALARYERLVEDLLEAFGTDPDPQTLALFRELLVGSPAVARPAAGADHGAKAEIGHLPPSLTSFVGRERELVDVERLSLQARLLTLTGAGGSGKTRLAVETARRVRSRYPDGVWFVDLSAVGESALVADAVAEALGLESDVAPDRARALVGQLRARHLLIILDNCEHLLSISARLVADVLTGCPGVDVLATSREPLHVLGEYTYRVPSLTLPTAAWNQEYDLDQLGRLPSVRLFVERAARVRPGFALDADNAQGVVDLCSQLDGMPLALELAAARAAVLEPAEIVHRLGDALSLLGGGPHSMTRHETLRSTLEWSHDLLTVPEQILLRRLSVFAGSFTLTAMEAVCGGTPPLPRTGLLDLLAKLVDKSLVGVEKAAEGTRYRQLETVRQFSREKLDRAREADQLLAAHCAYFLTVAVAHNPERSMGLVIEQPRLLDSEHDNLRAALLWSCVHDPDTALRLVASLWRFWFVRGHAVEGARWVERALAVSPGPTRPRAAALIGLTGLDSRQGRGDRYRSLGAEAMAIVQQIGDPDELTMAQIVEATLAWGAFDLDDAEQRAAAVRAEGIERERPEYAAAGSWLLGQCALFREDAPLAHRHFESSLAELAQVDRSPRPFLPVITHCLTLVPIAGRLVPCIEETMLLSRRVGVHQAPGYVLSAIGYADRLAGDQAAAISIITEAIDRFAELGDDLARAQTLHQVGCLHRDHGDYGTARAALTRAGALRGELGDRRGELLTEINVAVLDAMAGDIARGLGNARRSLSGFESAGDRVGMGATLSALGAIELLAGENRAAREMYRRAAERLAPWPQFSGWFRLLVAELSADLGDPHRVAREVTATAAIFDRSRSIIAGRRLAALRSV